MKNAHPWLTAVVLLFVIFGTIYAVAQQAERSVANYPQTQIAEDTAAALNQGVKPSSLVQGKVNLATSLAPFTIIYDRTGQVVAGSGYLNGTILYIPYGVLTGANGRSYNLVTWQPQTGVRIAVATVSANSYYVLSGRSLKEVESSEVNTLQLATLGGTVSIAVLMASYLAFQRKQRR